MFFHKHLSGCSFNFLPAVRLLKTYIGKAKTQNKTKRKTKPKTSMCSFQSTILKILRFCLNPRSSNAHCSSTALLGTNRSLYCKHLCVCVHVCMCFVNNSPGLDPIHNQLHPPQLYTILLCCGQVLTPELALQALNHSHCTHAASRYTQTHIHLKNTNSQGK